jgi:hypothetical protein
MDVQKLNNNLQQLKDQLKTLIAVSADLIDRNSQIDNGARCDNLPPLPRFENLLEDFLSICSVIELNLRTMQECIILGKASSQNLPLTVSNLKCDSMDNRVETIEPNSTVSYNQYISVIKYQVDTAKAIRSLLDEFVNHQAINQNHQQH